MKKWVCNLLILGMILGCYKGYVALWEKGSTEPLRQYPYPIRVFPSEDQDSLRRGIPIQSNEELARLLEDFLS